MSFCYMTNLAGFTSPNNLCMLSAISLSRLQYEIFQHKIQQRQIKVKIAKFSHWQRLKLMAKYCIVCWKCKRHVSNFQRIFREWDVYVILRAYFEPLRSLMSPYAWHISIQYCLRLYWKDEPFVGPPVRKTFPTPYKMYCSFMALVTYRQRQWASGRPSEGRIGISGACLTLFLCTFFFYLSMLDFSW